MQREHDRLERQLRDLCGFLPALSRNTDLQLMLAIYERGGRQLRSSENLERLVDTMEEHVKALRRLTLVMAAECKVMLAQQATSGAT